MNTSQLMEMDDYREAISEQNKQGKKSRAKQKRTKISFQKEQRRLNGVGDKLKRSCNRSIVLTLTKNYVLRENKVLFTENMRT